MSLLQNSNAISSGSYTINNSLRFRSSASAYLNRTPASAGNRKTFTYSLWLKRGNSNADIKLIQVGTGANQTNFCFNSSNQLNLFNYIGAVVNGDLTSSAVFRDFSAWYHIVFSIDTTQAINTNRFKIYVNGSLQNLTGTYPTQNTDFFINNNQIHWIGQNGSSAGYLDGYLAEVNFIDGQALTPSSFGQTDTLTGVWTAKKYTGTYGTNGFYLPFSDTTSATTLAYDKSGNGNNWTPNNISTTAGVTYDAMIDSPTLGVSGTQPVGNYAVMNPLWKGANTTISSANLNTIDTSSSGDGLSIGTIGVTTGKWYWEVTALSIVSGSSARGNVGILKNPETYSMNTYLGSNTNSWGYYSATGVKIYNNSQVSYGASWSTNDVIGIALDLDAGTLVFYKNNTSQGTAYTGLNTGDIYYPATSLASSGSLSFNFGQRPFQYSPPTGYSSLCTTNLP